jgi:hypothetical protein
MIYEIGEIYEIPHVKATFFGLRRNWPVLGPEHEDAEFINFPHQHYHLDWRFAPGPALRHIQAAYERQRGRRAKWINREHLPFGAVIHSADAPSPVLRRARCLRQWPEYPAEKAKWLPSLSAAYRDESLRRNRFCPHRGVDVLTLPPDAAGCVTCPLHGLRWDLATGRLA